MQKTLLAKIVLIVVAASVSATVAHGQFVAFNDHAPGTGTAANTTTWTADAVDYPNANTGPLKNITSGANLPVTVTASMQGNITWEGTQGNPAAGTPLY